MELAEEIEDNEFNNLVFLPIHSDSTWKFFFLRYSVLLIAIADFLKIKEWLPNI